MNAMELDIMRGMVSILNEASKAMNGGSPIMSDEQFAVRSNDLAILEAESGVVLLNSPNCAVDVRSMIKALEDQYGSLKEYQSVNDIIEFSNNKELIAYIDIIGLDMVVAYTNGYMNSIQINSTDECILDAICNLNIPYCITKKTDYIVKGKLVTYGKPEFYATEIIQGGQSTFKDGLDESRYLGFDIVQNWSISNLNPKSFQRSIDYIFERSEEDGVACNGIVFKLNNTEHGKMLGVMTNSAICGVVVKKEGAL